jgi:4'-phosphopantetheinyl transferase EntD
VSGVTIALRADDGRPVEALEAELRAPERVQAHAYTGRRRRHFAMGRLAAHAAIGTLGARPADVWIGADAVGAPAVAGGGPGLGIGIAHSGMLAIACAWATGTRRRRVGVDVERVRPTDVAGSAYAFSPRERRLLRASGIDPSRAGLLAWVAKEAAWKAIRFSADVGPGAVEIRQLAPDACTATVVARTATRAGQNLPATFGVRLGTLDGPDGQYVVGLAEERTGQ